MEITYAIYPETHKPARGMYTVQNPDMTAAGAREIGLVCGRNDTAAALVALSPRDGDVIFSFDCAARPFTRHRVSAGDGLPVVRLALPDCPDGVSVRAYTVLFHPCDDRIERGDALDVYPVQIVRAGETGYVYIEFTVAADAQPGVNDLELRLLGSRMFSDEEQVGSLTARLDVRARVLPDKRDMKFHLDLWQHSTSVARACRVPVWSDAHFKALEEVVRSLAELGQKCVTVIASDCPWSGQWCHYERRAAADLYEYSMIPVTRRADGGIDCDFSVMQRYIDLCAKYGIDREITVFGLVNVWCDGGGGFAPIADGHPDGAKIRFTDAVTGMQGYITDPGLIDEYVAQIERYFVRTGQIGRVRLIADEPADPDRYRASIDRIARVAPSFVLKAALNHSGFIGEFGDRVSDFVPSLECLCREYDRLCEYRRTMPGKRFLWYVCNMPAYPNTFLASDPCETLAIGALTALIGFDGFLRWGYTVWCADPVADNRYFNWPAGDLHFVYPARSGGVMLSLRYKLLKRAVELAELCESYRARHGDDALERLLSKVLPTRDPRAFFTDPPADADSPRAVPVPKKRLMSLDYSDYSALRAELLNN